MIDGWNNQLYCCCLSNDGCIFFVYKHNKRLGAGMQQSTSFTQFFYSSWILSQIRNSGKQGMDVKSSSLALTLFTSPNFVNEEPLVVILIKMA